MKVAPQQEARRRRGAARHEPTAAELEEEDKSSERPLWLKIYVAVMAFGFLSFSLYILVDHTYAHDDLLAKVDIMKKEAADLIMSHGDYKSAYVLAKRAHDIHPQLENAEFLASICLGLDLLQEALVLYREIFVYSTSLLVYQRYLTVLHRLGSFEERDAVFYALTHNDHRLAPWLTVYQCPDRVEESLLPGAKPFHDPQDFRVTRRITAAMPRIQKEFRSYMAGKNNSLSGFISNQDADVVEGNTRGAWTELLLFERGMWDYRLCSIGMPFHNTCKAMRGLPEIEGRFRGYRVGQVSFLRLMPGTHLVPHYGSVNWRLTASCGIEVPPDVTIKAGTEASQWKENECLVLDDSFLHEVWHNGTEPRVVLFANFLVVESED